MKSQAALITAPEPSRRRASSRPGRVMLIAALVLLAAPLAVAAWGLGGYSAQRERNNADARLAGSLNDAGRVYGRLISDADSAATRLARHRRIQHRVLIWRMGPNGDLSRWHHPVP